MYDHKAAYERKFGQYIKVFGQDMIFVTVNKASTSEHVGFSIKGAKGSSVKSFAKTDTDMTDSILSTEIKVLWKDIEPYLLKLDISFDKLEKHIIEIKIGVETFHIYEYYLNSFNNILVIKARNIT